MNRKEKIIVSAMLAALIAIVVSISMMKPASTPLGGIIQAPSYNSVSTNIYAVGAGANTTILTQKGGRGYANICNNSANKGYIYLYSTSTVATSSGSIPLPTGTCYEINRDNLYTGDVGYVSEVATTTSLHVVEFIGY